MAVGNRTLRPSPPVRPCEPGMPTRLPRPPGPQPGIDGRLCAMPGPLTRFIPVEETPARRAVVEAPARLHFGLFQMSDAYARGYMGAGAAVRGPRWRISLEASADHRDWLEGVPYELQAFTRDVLARLRSTAPVPPVTVEVEQDIPLHVGLGSKTSFGSALLAAAVALVPHHPRPWHYHRGLLARGGASGAGINTAVSGGFVLDAGHLLVSGDGLLPSSARAPDQPPVAIARWAGGLPRFLLIRPLGHKGLSGAAELAFFRRELPLSKRTVDEVAGLVLYRLLPALSTQDADGLISALQDLQGTGFKELEWALQPEAVHQIRHYALTHGARAVALSSMGPALAAFGDNLDRVADALPQAFPVQVWYSSFRDRGVEVNFVEGTYS